MHKTFDIIIIGAGVAGLSLAALLQQHHLSVLIIDHHAVPEAPQGIDLMQRALNHTAEKIFQDIGMWQALDKGIYDKMFVWDDAANIAFKARDIAQSHLGHIISYRQLQHALYQYLSTKNNITLLYDAPPERFMSLGQEALVQVAGQHYTAPLVVGADGKHSWLRQTVGVNVSSKSYGEKALVATITTEKPHQHTAWQRFLPTGPLAFLPLSDVHHCSFVWTNADEESERLLQLDELTFLNELNQACEEKLGKVTSVSIRAAFPLVLQHAKQYVGDTWAIIADAAHAVHPLAGLCLNLGLGDVRCLADVIIQDKPLRHYERQRRSANQQALWFIDKLHDVFLTDNKPLAWLRDQGLRTVANSSVLQKFFIRRVE